MFFVFANFKSKFSRLLQKRNDVEIILRTKKGDIRYLLISPLNANRWIAEYLGH